MDRFEKLCDETIEWLRTRPYTEKCHQEVIRLQEEQKKELELMAQNLHLRHTEVKVPVS